MLTVDTDDADLAGTICEMAAGIVDDLASCGLRQTTPLTIEVVGTFSHPIGECLAYFDCGLDLVRITHPSLYGELLESDVIYARLPPEIALRALLTHELTHALLEHATGEGDIALVDHEYVAAAMELELMEPEWRDVVIASAPVSLPPKPGLIDMMIYGFAPRRFAVNAWQHFSLPENGCDLVQRIAEGEVTFHHPPL
jgi:hypothetical protein